MAYKEKGTKRRLRSSYITSVISISLVLFMLGLMGLLILNANQLSNYVKENIGVTVVLKDNIKEVEIRRLQKILDASDYVKATKYVDKETAAKEFEKELGEDFISFLGYNPLRASIDVKLYAGYANTDSIAVIEKHLLNTYHTYVRKEKNHLKKTYWYLLKAGDDNTELTPQLEEAITEAVYLPKAAFDTIKKNTYKSIKDVLKAINKS